MLSMLRNLAFVATILLPLEANSQTMIAGVPVFCNDKFGIPVQTILSPELPDVGMAGIMPDGVRIIYLNSVMLSSLPPRIQLFWYAHECAHHALGHTYGFNKFGREIEADCWAIKLGRNQGWITPQVLKNMERYFFAYPGSPWGHLPGPLRIQNFWYCYVN